MTTLRAGFIGLGSQGGPMAQRIAEQQLPLTVWARRRGALAPFEALGASSAPNPAELAAASDVVGICVVNDADVLDVVLREDGVLAGMAEGGIITIHSTVHPDTVRAVADASAHRGVAVLDAPVSGGGIAAAEGRLLVMVGGDVEVLERCRPVLSTFGDPIVHLGPLGSGEIAKVINNLVFTAHLAVALDTYAFGERLGIPRAALAEVLRNGSGGSFGASVIGGSAGAGMGGAAALLRKDVDIAAALAEQHGIAPAADVTTLAETAIAALIRSQ